MREKRGAQTRLRPLTGPVLSDQAHDAKRETTRLPINVGLVQLETVRQPRLQLVSSNRTPDVTGDQFADSIKHGGTSYAVLRVGFST